MPCGAVLTFDTQTDNAIRGLWQVIDDAGLSSNMLAGNTLPHITLLACQDMDLDGYISHLPAFLADYAPLTIDFPGLGIFTGAQPTVYLTVTRTPMLTAMHAAFWKLAGPFIKGESLYYHPDGWVPHVTLDQDMPVEQTGAIVNALLRTTRPEGGQVLRLHIIDFDNGLHHLFSEPLGGRRPF